MKNTWSVISQNVSSFFEFLMYETSRFGALEDVLVHNARFGTFTWTFWYVYATFKEIWARFGTAQSWLLPSFES